MSFLSKLLLVVVVVLVSACGNAAPLVPVVDDLRLPETWHVAKTIVIGDSSSGCVSIADASCPSITRYYTVEGDLPQIFQQAKAALGAGFGSIEAVLPSCDAPPGGPRCFITARMHDVRLDMTFYPPGENVDQQGIGVPGRATVRVIAR